MRKDLVSEIAESTQLLRTAAKAADEKLGTDIVGLDVSSTLYITDAFLIASADNERQIDAIIDAVEQAVQVEHGRTPLRREGRGGDWVLLDFGEIVVHVFSAEQREYYALERLWKDVPAIDLQLPAPGQQSTQTTGSDETSDDEDR
jgi:ribosome-associated protein